MRCRLAGEHFPAGVLAKVDARKDQKIHEAATEEITRGKVGMPGAHCRDIDGEFRQRGGRRQEDTTHEQSPKPGGVGNRIGCPRKERSRAGHDYREH
jgi:hypothetical protein